MGLSEHDRCTFREYAKARKKLLSEIGIADSCRDPMSEFAEWVAMKELGGTLADSRVQKGYDLVLESRERVQVKYLSNPNGKWRNEHHVVFTNHMEHYAIVFFENLAIIAMISFPKNTISNVCVLLGKRHPNQHSTLQLTKKNFTQIMEDSDAFEQLGVKCFRYATPIP